MLNEVSFMAFLAGGGWCNIAGWMDGDLITEDIEVRSGVLRSSRFGD